MKKHFATYEIAIILKEKGFNEDCLGVYIDKELTIGLPETTLNVITKYYDILEKEEYLLAPLWQQAIDWLREKHRFIITIDFLNKQESLHPNDPEWTSELYNMDNFHHIIAEYDRYSYEDARQVTIEHALTLI